MTAGAERAPSGTSRSWQPPGGPPPPPNGGPYGPSGGWGPDGQRGRFGPGPGPGNQWRPAGGEPRRRPRGATSFGAWVRAHGAFTVVLAGLLALLVYGVYRRHIVNQFDLIILISFIPSVILHEVSHGVVALWCGDDTAKQAKRLTLNPLRHIDPIGSVLLPIMLILTVGRAFGWAKPVPVRIDRLRHPRNQAVLVGLAGPATNILLSAGAGLAFHFLYTSTWNNFYLGVPNASPLPLFGNILFGFGLINLILAGFNLLPIPPLDGSALVERAIPRRYLAGYYRVRTAFLIVVLLVVLLFQAPLTHLFAWLENLWLEAVGATTQ
jgi:Zn-dependent protease